jgi:hypothetical protein
LNRRSVLSPTLGVLPAAGAAQTAAQPGRVSRRTAASTEISGTMASEVTHIEQLERHLLRRGLGALEADRDRCADCGRTPLTGEHVHLYDAHGGEVVCELCRTLRRQAPVASEIVRHCEHGQTVRLTARAA